MKNGKVVLGVLAGMATGALFGILFAPDKGSKTRKKIADKGQGYVDEAGQKFNSFVDDMSRQLNSVKEEARRIVSNGKAAMEEAVEEVHATANRKNSKS